jgi:hypothetical protein
MINMTAFVNGARDIVSSARGTLSRADTDMADEEFDAALDHLRIARETIERAERAVRELAKMAEEAKAA